MEGTVRATRSAARRRIGAFAVFAVLLGSLVLSEADVSPANSFEEHFEYPNGTPLTLTPGGGNWVLSPNVPAGWVVETRPTTLNTSQLGTVSVLVGKQRQGPPNEPIAFVNRSFSNFVAQTQAAFDRIVPPTSGIGMVFRAGVDPLTNAIDSNNLYLFTAINVSPNARTFPTGHAFMLFKRVAGTYYVAAPPVHTYIDFANSRMHTYKVAMSGTRIQAWVDGLQVFDIVDTPGSDAQTGGYQMPGPAFATGAIGLRTSGTAALFDDVVIAGAPAYEARATAVNVFGQLGTDSALRTSTAQGTIPLGVEEGATGGDSGWQYHDHDFSTTTGGLAEDGPIGTALLTTKGFEGTTSSSAQIAGLAGVFTDPNGRTTVTVSADLIRANASSSCEGSTSSIDVVNLNYEVVSRDASGEPYVHQGNVTRFGAAPNTNLVEPNSTVGPLPSAGPVNPNGAFSTSPVRITLHSRKTTSEHPRIDVAALRITFFQRASGAAPNSPGIVLADVALGNVVAGKLCAPGA